MIYQTGNLPQPFNRYGVKTKLIDDTDYKRLVYHQTEIAAIHKTNLGYMLYMQTDGWTTPTTKKRLNHFLKYFDIPFHIYQKNHIWYISTPRGTVKFQTTSEMLFNINGFGNFKTENRFKIT